MKMRTMETTVVDMDAVAFLGVGRRATGPGSSFRPPPPATKNSAEPAWLPVKRNHQVKLNSRVLWTSSCRTLVRGRHRFSTLSRAAARDIALGDDRNFALVSPIEDIRLSGVEVDLRNGTGDGDVGTGLGNQTGDGEIGERLGAMDDTNGASFELEENGRARFDPENVSNIEDASERFKLRHGREVFEERAYLVGIERKGVRSSLFGITDSLAELAQLAETAGLLVVSSTYQKLDHPSPRTYIGSGKVSEVRTDVRALDIETVIFDDELSAGQLRNLEKAFGNDVRVCDRTALILDIFSQRAATREATLQVGLAQMEYQLPRLTRMWTHLERQAGGMVKGMGEKQIEVDKRILRDRMAVLRKELDSVREHRQQYRDRRASVPIPVVSLVGYTNAGKSTLLNKLSGAGVLAEDRLFATLDPTTRRIELPNGNECLITDTVGFIQKLPTQLVASFRATLEEISDSSLLVHVVDISHPLAREQMEAVENVLAELSVEHIPQITVWNKVDRADKQDSIRTEASSRDDVVCMSALTGEGIGSLCSAIQSKLKESLVWVDALVPYEKGEFVNLIHRLGVVDQVEYLEEGIALKAHVPLALSRQLQPMRQAV